MSDEEEMVAVTLDNDYYTGAYFSTYDGYPNDYVVPRSHLERWEAAKAAYEDMQSEIDQAMSEQRERVMALRRERRGPKSPMEEFIEQAYSQQLTHALQVPATFRRSADKESE